MQIGIRPRRKKIMLQSEICSPSYHTNVELKIFLSRLTIKLSFSLTFFKTLFARFSAQFRNQNEQIFFSLLVYSIKRRWHPSSSLALSSSIWVRDLAVLFSDSHELFHHFIEFCMPKTARLLRRCLETRLQLYIVKTLSWQYNIVSMIYILLACSKYGNRQLVTGDLSQSVIHCIITFCCFEKQLNKNNWFSLADICEFQN